MENSEDDHKRLFRIKCVSILAVVAITLLLNPMNVVSSLKGSDNEAKIEKQEHNVPEKIEVDESTEEVLSYLSYCESRDRQFDSDGSVLRGVVNPKDVGKWQINEYYWLEKSLELGYDIYTEEGNRAMAIHILEAQGIEAWSASAECLEREFGFLIE